MIYPQSLQNGSKFEYWPRVFESTVTLKSQVGNYCTVVDEAGEEFVVSCDDLVATEPPKPPRCDFPMLPNGPLSKEFLRDLHIELSEDEAKAILDRVNKKTAECLTQKDSND